MTASTKFRRLMQLAVVVVCVELALVFASVGAYKHFIPAPPGLSNNEGYHFGHDFIVFFATARMTMEGRAAAAFDLESIHETQQALVNRDMANANTPWVYPPTFLLLVLPFGLLPYVTAYAAWCAANVAAGAAAGWTVLRRWWMPLLVAFFPATGLNLFAGQNGGITAGLMLGGLGLLTRHPAWAGVLFGLMSYKPQFGILIPIALAAGRQRTAFLSAAVTVVGFAAVSYLAFGGGPWQMLLSQAQSDWGTQAELLWLKSITVYPMARGLGLDQTAASILQGVSALLAIGIVLYSWRRTSTPELRAAALTVGTLLATPRAMMYDLAVLLVPLVFVLARAVRYSFLTDWVFGGFLWLCPLVGYFTFERISFQFWPALLWPGLLFCLLRYRYPAASGAVLGEASRDGDPASEMAKQEMHRRKPNQRIQRQGQA